MAKSKDSDTKDIKKQRIKLGKLIKKCRGERSLRNVAAAVDLFPSNLKYIEDGVNAPSPEIYIKLMHELEPKGTVKKKYRACVYAHSTGASAGCMQGYY